ncbi:MAG: hypothetical protein VYE22_33465 [Myxococcota bacterium]|nr:hypothetical protein [Myxococcota bacterium]
MDQEQRARPKSGVQQAVNGGNLIVQLRRLRETSAWVDRHFEDLLSLVRLPEPEAAADVA